MNTRIVDLEVVYQTQTDGAICFNEDEDGEDLWVPLSLAEMEPENPSRGDDVTITVPEWWALQEGLI
jgi:hypothetical protein